jgi:hypothetical protein
MPDSTLTLADVKTGFFLKMPSDAEALTKFLIENHLAIQKENDLLKVALKALESDEAYAKYHALSLRYEELLALYHKKRNESKHRKDNWTSYLSDNLGTLHAYRIIITFARLTDEQLICMLSQAKWFNDLNQAMAGIFNFDQSISILNLPVETLHALSVMVLALRFLVVSAEILRHTFAPTDEEAADLSTWERFCHETGIYGFSLVNDFVWGTVNALSNYHDFFNIPLPVANILIAAALIFDISLLMYRYHLETTAYEAKKATYLAEIKKIEGDEELEKNAIQEKVKLTQEQLKALEFSHIKTTAALQLAWIAAGIVSLGFAISLAVAAPVAAPMGCFLCLLGTAVYTSLGDYGDYQQQKHLLETLKQDNQQGKAEIGNAEKAQKAAWNHGVESLLKHTLLPMFVISVFAVCWPAGLLLAIAYGAYEMSPSTLKDVDQKSSSKTSYSR